METALRDLPLPFPIGAYYTDNNVKNNAAGTNFCVDANGYNTAKDAFVVYVSKSF